MVEWVTYPVYPAVRLVTVHCLPQSTASTSSSPSSPIDVFTWRALVPHETDLAHRLQKLPAQHLPERFVAVLQSENSEGRAAQERGDWKTAMAKFETRRTMISEDLRKLVPVHVEEQDFDLLLAWADLPLAELYQSLGSGDSVMLKKAMEMRKEVLRCVTWILGSSFWPRGDNPLPTNNGVGSSPGDLLVQVCVTYYYTAQYEWGCALNNEPARVEAVQKFANFVGCGDDEAESQICLLLSVDYQYLGRFEVGLGWIEEADRHWPQISPGVDEYRRILRLSKAELLIKVEKFEEAVKTLEELQDKERGLELLRIRLQSACYLQMSRRAACNGNFNDAKVYEKKAQDFEREFEGVEDSELEGSEPDELQFTFGQIPLSHPMLKATPCPLGSSLGLVREGYVPLRNELRKLPVIQSGVLQDLHQQGETARERRDWQAATYWYERMRELLKLTARVVEKQTYDWLLSWCDLTLANFYHYHTRRFEKARTMWVDLLSSASHQMGSAHEFLLHGYRFNLAAVLFEGFGEVLNQPYHVLDGNKACGTDSNTSERHSCFWLYFGHHRVLNYETALHWLRESKRLKEEHIAFCSNVGCPEMTCSNDDYFCCDYDYLRCEADLLMKLQKFEEAITVLEKLLRTRHVQQGSPLHARQASEWLYGCRYSMGSIMANLKGKFDPLSVMWALWGILAENLNNRTKAELFETSSAVDIEHGNGSAEKLPSTFGCIRVSDAELMLVQSQAGLEHHLHQLPVHLHMAFCWHGNRGSSYLKLCQWEAAIFEFEWCREILKIVRVQSSEVELVKACDWLMVWASVPLADIFEFRKKQIKKALDLRDEIAKIICTVNRQYAASHDDEDNEDVLVECTAVSLLLVGRYHYSVSEYLDVKDEVVRAFGGIRKEEDWINENFLLSCLYRSHIRCGNYEAALRFVRQAKQVFDQRFSGQELHHMDILFNHVKAEAQCLGGLNRPDDAAKVLRKYIVESSDTAEKAQKLPEGVLLTQLKAKHCAEFCEDVNDKFSTISPIQLLSLFQSGVVERFNGQSGIWQLRKKSLEFSKNGELLKAVECYENSCIELINKTRKEGLEGTLDDKLNVFDYFWLSMWRLTLIYQTVDSCSYEQIKAYRQDVNLLRTVHYYEKVIELTPSSKLETSAEMNTKMATVYERIDECYVYYLLKLYDESRTKSIKIFCYIHCMRDDVEVLWRQSYRDIHSGNYTGVRLPLQDAIDEIHTFLGFDVSVGKYGVKAVDQFTRLLYSMGGSSYTEDWWVGLLESHHILYKILQNHHYRRARCFACLKGPGEDFQKQIETEKWNAFRYAEAERAQVLLFQQLVASNKLNSTQQWGHNVHSMEYIRKLCATVFKRPSVYVQYSSFKQPSGWFYIYVIDQDGNLSIIRGGIDCEEGTRKLERKGGARSAAVKKPLSLEKRLNNLYRYLEKGDFHNYNGDSMKKDLMFLYGLLIKPIAHILRKMKPDDNLIFCPSELFTKVPFAALRDSESSQKYLIELHIISLVPSLRILHSCNERLEQLQSSHSYTGCAGSIIALGDPNYKCPTCKKKFTRLKGTRDEVKHISTLFGETAVKKLLRRHATREQLRFWAAKASDDSSSFRQAIVHIGAHGTMDEKHNKKIVSLQLACDDPANFANIGAPSLSDDTSSSDEEITSDKYGKRHEVESDDNSDEDWTDSDDEESGLQINMSPSKPFNVQSMFEEDTSFQESSQGASSSRSRAKIGRNARTTQQSVTSHALKVEDLNSFEWRAELVVLSACLSGRGRITTEGVLSFARAFMIVGVPCVVASQWKVDDDTTVALMKVFYEELHQGKNVASALRSSMLAHMSTHRDSVGHWAPFNVWGVSSLCLPEALLDPHRSREHPMSVSPLQVDLAGGEGNELQFPSIDGGEELSSSTKDSIGQYICGECSSVILTRRWHCNMCPKSFDLCESCEADMFHGRDHPMTPIITTSDRNLVLSKEHPLN